MRKLRVGKKSAKCKVAFRTVQSIQLEINASCFEHFAGKIVQSLLHTCFQKMFTGFHNKKVYQFSCFKAIHEISALRNYNGNVSGKH